MSSDLWMMCVCGPVATWSQVCVAEPTWHQTGVCVMTSFALSNISALFDSKMVVVGVCTILNWTDLITYEGVFDSNDTQ